jgi:hypothetical protein
MCERKRRALQKNEKRVQAGFMAFNRWWQLAQNAKKLKTATVNGKDIKYQGFELLAINQLLEEGYLIEDIKNGKGEVPNFIYHFDGRNRRYYPDIYIPKDNRIIEVKSKWTYEQELSKNLAKRKIVIDSGYEFDFYIMEK